MNNFWWFPGHSINQKKKAIKAVLGNLHIVYPKAWQIWRWKLPGKINPTIDMAMKNDLDNLKMNNSRWFPGHSIHQKKRNYQSLLVISKWSWIAPYELWQSMKALQTSYSSDTTIPETKPLQWHEQKQDELQHLSHNTNRYHKWFPSKCLVNSKTPDKLLGTQETSGQQNTWRWILEVLYRKSPFPKVRRTFQTLLYKTHLKWKCCTDIGQFQKEFSTQTK